MQAPLIPRQAKIKMRFAISDFWGFLSLSSLSNVGKWSASLMREFNILIVSEFSIMPWICVFHEQGIIVIKIQWCSYILHGLSLAWFIEENKSFSIHIPILAHLPVEIPTWLFIRVLLQQSRAPKNLPKEKVGSSVLPPDRHVDDDEQQQSQRRHPTANNQRHGRKLRLIHVLKQQAKNWD